MPAGCDVVSVSERKAASLASSTCAICATATTNPATAEFRLEGDWRGQLVLLEDCSEESWPPGLDDLTW